MMYNTFILYFYNFMNNKFCYIYGSFNEDIQKNGIVHKLREGQDVDVVSNMDVFEIRVLLFRHFPHLFSYPTKDNNMISIDVKSVEPVDNSIHVHNCHWQKCEFYELFNQQNIKYKFDCAPSSSNPVVFNTYLRDPNKSNFAKIMTEPIITNIHTNHNYNHTIRRHYGEVEYNSVINKLDHTEQFLFKTMKEKEWKVSPQCIKDFGNFISVVKQNQTVTSTVNNFSLSYDDFIKKCYLLSHNLGTHP